VSIAYYFKPIIESWFKPEAENSQILINWSTKITLLLLSVALAILGCWPSLLFNLFAK